MSVLALEYLNLHYGVVYEFRYEDGSTLREPSFTTTTSWKHMTLRRC
jgi:hypothetical protein